MRKDIVKEASTERTAIISILTKDPTDRQRFNKEVIDYTVHLSFVGATILPPYLPRLLRRARREDRLEILRRLDGLRERYNQCLDDMEVTEEAGKSILEKIRSIGSNIARYIPQLEPILGYLSKMGVENVIIHTDDYAIPWMWTYYIQADDSDSEDESEDVRRNPYDFLLTRFSCGTLLVDEDDKALDRFQQFTDGLLRFQTDEESLGNMKVCLLQGVLGHRESDKVAGNEYIRHFKDLLLPRFRIENNINAFGQDDYERFIENQRPSDDRSQVFVSDFLSGRLQDSKIIHYSGHIDQGCLLFDTNIRVSPIELTNYLLHFRHSPLVILHGCSSARIVDVQNRDSQLPTVFLNNGASGCLVALLPVDQPMRLRAGGDSMIDLFYRYVMTKKLPYGKALREARKEFRKKNKYNPQWLFFTLYGDPRAMLITTSGKAYMRKVQSVQEKLDEEESVAETRQEGRVALAFNGDLISVLDFQQELTIQKFEEVDPIEPIRPLGTPEVLQVLGSPEAIAIYKLIGTQVVGTLLKDTIGEIIKKIFKRNNLVASELSSDALKQRVEAGKTKQLLHYGYYNDSTSTNYTWVTLEVSPMTSKIAGTPNV